jgi:hypothetical protein
MKAALPGTQSATIGIDCRKQHSSAAANLAGYPRSISTTAISLTP